MRFALDAAISGKVDMFDGSLRASSFKRPKRPSKVEELKSCLQRYDTSKREIGKQLDYIAS